jgi:hypothetical protein
MRWDCTKLLTKRATCQKYSSIFIRQSSNEKKINNEQSEGPPKSDKGTIRESAMNTKSCGLAKCAKTHLQSLPIS